MNTLTHLGLKATVDDEGNVSGWLAPFGGPFNGKDIDGETFTPKTDFALDYYPTLPVLYGHGGDPEVGAAKVGEITLKEIRDQGVWVQGQLDRQSAYYAAIRELAEKGDMYWSSGALAHLVQRNAKTGEIKQWPIAEATLTLTPANPLAEATVKETVTETITDVEDPGVTITFTTSAAKEAAQALHDHALTLGATCPEVVGEAKEAPPAEVLAPAGDSVEPATPADLDAIKELMVAAALSEARRLTG